MEDNYTIMEKLCQKALKEKKLHKKQDYKDRLEYELQIIKDKDFVDYFFIVKDVVDAAREKGIMLGPGRGSSGGSLIAYLLDITQIDPLKFGLYFERFINPARHDNPDADLDFQSSRRDEMFEYLEEKYGKECVARIPSIVKFKPKSALRDLARIEGIPIQEVNLLTKNIPDNLPLEHVLKLKEASIFLNKYPRVAKILPQLLDKIRHTGVHAAACVITPISVDNFFPLEKKGRFFCASFDKDALEDLGFLKLDLLSLKTLDVIDEAIKNINKNGYKIKLPLEPDDPEIYNHIFIPAYTNGVFQFETTNLTDYARKVKIDSFKLLTDTTSIARPGTAASGDAAKYIDRRHGKESVQYIHPSLEPILHDTYGIIVYQEQIMRIVNEVGGLPLSDAEIIRKLISKSKGISALENYRNKFVEGAQNNGVSKDLANKIWDSIKEAGNYSFNLSHAVAYSLISYWCAWLKRYYPREFLAALMRFEEGGMFAAATEELKLMGYKVLDPDVNTSDNRTSINESGDVLIGLEDVDQVGSAAVEEIKRLRPFKSFDDFLDRVEARKVNSRSIKHLIFAGAFEAFGEKEKLYYRIATDEKPRKWTDKEEIMKKYAVIKTSPRQPIINFFDHTAIQATKNNGGLTDIGAVDWESASEEVYIKGIITEIDIKIGYAIMDINDGTGTANVLIPKESLDKYREIFEEGTGTPILIKAHKRAENSRFYLDMLIDLRNELESDSKEYRYLTGETYKYITEQGRSGEALVVSSSYFLSKQNQNRGTRLTLINQDGMFNRMCFDSLQQDIEAGDIIKFQESGYEQVFIKFIDFIYS